MPRIVVIATGGTISSRPGRSGGSVATDSASELLSGVPTLPHDVDVEAYDVLKKNSFNLTMTDLQAIVSAVDVQLEREDVDGIVVTHGTDTMEETAFLADLVHDDSRPVVFTGAQLGADDPASDGPRNLYHAIIVACSSLSRDCGVLVSFAGQVFAARGLRKRHTLAMAPFDGYGTGPIGHVVGSDVIYQARPVRQRRFAPPGAGFGRIRVDCVMSYPGADDALLRASVDAGARGIVIVGTGSGNPNDALVSAIADATARGVVVAIGSRAGDGPVIPIYGSGGAVDAVGAGAVPVGLLPISQARILLTVLLDALTPDEAAAALRRYCSIPIPGPIPEPLAPSAA